ncbi:MAG: hypothetical protein KDK40_03880 [Chlamydiia bacterium]|nr:hypothetical protein [Chlamydiia bacterium]
MFSSPFPGTSVIPGPLIGGVHILCRIRAVCKWRSRALDLYNNPMHFNSLCAGGVLNALAGDFRIVRTAAQVVLFSRRVIDGIGQYGNLLSALKSSHKAYEDLKTAWEYPPIAYLDPADCDYPDLLIDIFDRQTCHTIHKSSLQCICTAKHLGNHLWILIQRLFQILLEAFKLSLCYLDAMEALCIDSRNQEAAVNELFVHTIEVLDTLVKNREKLKAELIEHRDNLDRAFKLLGAPIGIDTLITALDRHFVYVERMVNGAKRVYKAAENTLWEGFKSWKGRPF